MGLDRSGNIPLWRQHMWLSWQQQLQPLDWDSEEFEYEEDEWEGLDLGTKH